MLNTEKFIEALKSIAGVEKFCGVPCSNLKALINYCSSNNMYLEVPNEGEAVAYSVGEYLGAKNRVGILMQNSGLTNALNAITSLSYIYKIPQVFIIGFRGMHGPGTDEPQHELMGNVTSEWLIDCNISIKYTRYYEDKEKELAEEVKEELSQGKSVAILVDKNEFSEYEPYSYYIDIIKSISRDDVLKTIHDLRDENTVVVTTTGFTSRAMYDKFDSDANFMMVGSMGDALAIGCGIAKSRPDKKVIVVDGDGAIMMRPQVAILAQVLNLPNLCHVVIENGKYESTGNQYCPGVMSYDLDSMLTGLYEENGAYNHTFYKVEYLSNYIKNFLKGQSIVKFIIMKVSTDLNDNNLGRPKESSYELGKRFMKYMGLE